MPAPTTSVAEQFPWLRSDPAVLTGDPPDTFESLARSHKGRWEQVYLEWLRGSTEGIANTSLVDPDLSADEVFAEYLEYAQPGTADDRAAALEAKFQPSYGAGFTFDVGLIQRAVAARVKQLKDEARAKGQKIPSEKEARLQTGKEIGKAAMARQVEAQRATLGNVNIALVANLQLKQYQVTALQDFNLALNNLGKAKWDEPDPDHPEKSKGPSPEKEDALNVLAAAGTGMFNAYGEVSATAAAITSLGPGVEVPKEAADKLAEDLLAFGQAIAAQADAMGQAGRLFTSWSKRVTREFVAENFDAIYPYAGAGLLALRTLANLTKATTSSFPGYGWIGTVVGAADAALEMAVTNLVALKDAQSVDLRKKYALQKFAVKAEYQKDLLIRADAAKQKLDDFVDKVQRKTLGRVTQALDDGVHAGVVAMGATETQYATAKTVGGKAFEVVNIPAGALGVELELPTVGSLLESGLEEALDNVPGGGAIMTAGTIFFDVASFYRAIHSELVNADGVSDEDVELVRKLIDAPPQNLGFQLFANDKGVLVESVEFPIVQVRTGGIRLGLNLKTNAVTITDEGMISAEILRYAMQWAKNHPNDDRGLRYLGRVYTPDWGSWQLHLDRSTNSPFQASVSATYVTPSQDYDVRLDLAVDLGFEEVAIVKSSLQLNPEGLDGKLEYNEMLPVGAKPFPISTDDLAGFAGKDVTFDGVTYTLGQAMGELKPDAQWAWLAFDMTATDEAGNAATLELSYATYQPLQVEKVISSTSAGLDAKFEVDQALGPLIAHADAKFDAARLRAMKKKRTFIGKTKDLLGL